MLDFGFVVKLKAFTLDFFTKLIENFLFNVGIKKHKRAFAAVIFTAGQTCRQGNCVENTVHGITSKNSFKGRGGCQPPVLMSLIF